MTRKRFFFLMLGVLIAALVSTGIVFFRMRLNSVPKPTREEYIQSLVEEVRKVQEGGNWVRIGTNGWFYFISISSHCSDDEHGYDKFGYFVARPYSAALRYTEISVGVDNAGQLYFSDQHICGGMRSFYRLMHTSCEAMEDLRKVEPSWVSLPAKYNPSATNRKGTSNQAWDATSDPAPSAPSSSHQR